MSASAETGPYDQGHAGFAASVMERARALDPDFLVVPQNGLKLPTNGGRPDSHLVAATDAGGQEDLPYGATANCPAPREDHARLLVFLDLAERSGANGESVDSLGVVRNALYLLNPGVSSAAAGGSPPCRRPTTTS